MPESDHIIDSKCPDQDDIEYVIEILPDGNVMIPRGHPLWESIAKALGDESAELFCRQADLVRNILGRRMCG